MDVEPAPSRTGQQRVRISRVQGTTAGSAFDEVAREEALQLMVNSLPLAIMLRTPGSDLELALGLLHAEGVVAKVAEIASVRIAPSGQRDLHFPQLELELDPEAENLVDVKLRAPLPDGGLGWQRALPSSSACGICGAATLEALQRFQPPVEGDFVWPIERIFHLPEMLAESQRVFSTTGGLHAAGLLSWEGSPMMVAEDVGRHNAVDKLVGRALAEGRLPLTNSAMVVSGRAGFEIVQKAAAAQVAVVASISAPSSLAVQTAELLGVTLIGFLRGERCNVYSRPDRVGLPGGPGAG